MYVPFFNLNRGHQDLNDPIQVAIQDVFSTGNFIKGKHRVSFENRFAQFIGRQHCIGVGSGTEALFFVLKALGICEHDEVITPAYSFIASSACIRHVGANVVFADCDKTTGTITPQTISPKISPRTKAIIVVHLYGYPVDMQSIMQLAKAHHLYVIEDCAQAHHGKINHRMLGSLGDVSCFSFYPTKNLGACGNAGAILSDNSKLISKIRLLTQHGRINSFYHCIEGLNSQLDEIQAAILNVKLNYLSHWHQRRQHLARIYTEALSPYCLCPKQLSNQEHAYHLYVIQTRHQKKVQQSLFNAGIETIIHYPMPLPFLEAYHYLNHSSSQFPVVWQLKDKVLSLPLHPWLTDNEVDYILEKTVYCFKGML